MADGTNEQDLWAYAHIRCDAAHIGSPNKRVKSSLLDNAWPLSDPTDGREVHMIAMTTTWSARRTPVLYTVAGAFMVWIGAVAAMAAAG